MCLPTFYCATRIIEDYYFSVVSGVKCARITPDIKINFMFEAREPRPVWCMFVVVRGIIVSDKIEGCNN